MLRQYRHSKENSKNLESLTHGNTGTQDNAISGADAVILYDNSMSNQQQQ